MAQVSAGVGGPACPEHRIFARVWARMSGTVGSPRQRSELLAGLEGARVLEVGAGDGRNFSHYPAGVGEVLAVEPEPYLRERALAAAARAAARVTVVAAAAELLPAEDGAFDAVVSSLVLCTVADQARAIAEMRRVLRRGGELRFFEHVRAERPLGRGVQSSLDRSGLWPRIGGGCHLSRDTLAALRGGGFEIERVRGFKSGPGRLGVPFVLGAARLGEAA